MPATTTLRFATLGPAGSNHAFAAARYIAFHGLAGHATISLHGNFADAVDGVLGGGDDFLIQCAVHPATPGTVAGYFRGLYVIDTFISASRDLAVLRRTDAPPPGQGTVGAMVATLGYADLQQWGRVVPADTVSAVAEGLLAGTFDAGLTFESLAAEHPGRFQVAQRVRSVDDAWIVYGRAPAADGAIVACADGPAAAMYRRLVQPAPG